MKLKLDDKGNVVLQDGKPVYVHDDGKEVAFDAPATIATIARLNGEAKGHREAKEAAEGKLASFKGIDDPAAAIAALGTVKNLSDKKLVDAGEVDKIKAETIKAVRAEFEPVVKERDKYKADLDTAVLGGSFARSKYIADKLAIPGDLVEARFGKHFEVKDGKPVAKDAAGNPIYSRTRPGELADFDEAIESLVGAYPQKEHILKGSGGKGSGAPQSPGGAPGGPKTVTRTVFDAMDPIAKAAAGKEMAAKTLTVVDG